MNEADTNAKAIMLRNLEARAALAEANNLPRTAKWWREYARVVETRVDSELIYSVTKRGDPQR
jgi:hypothetical protein